MSAGTAGGEETPEQFARALAREDRVLLDVRDELYAGDWDELERDLRARLAGKPYIFKLATKIEEDLARIERLRRFETARGVDLGEVTRQGEGPEPERGPGEGEGRDDEGAGAKGSKE
ncbi:MAG TPA: hypothetical protein VHF22_09480 [Planctomycetota bacterium]|nr:hypothetical protein [Planctomycetota bacterium]